MHGCMTPSSRFSKLLKKEAGSGQVPFLLAEQGGDGA